MDFQKKSLASFGLAALSYVAALAFQRLRHIGMTWIGNAGFLRLIGLTTFCVLFIGAPIVLAVAVWFDRPRTIVRR
ncbi:MAG TPA: hypothetical protein VIM53_02170 [Candidatus Saccharimonadales bacterium]